MRIIFWGTPDFAVPILESLRQLHDVVAIVSQPDKMKGRKKTPIPPPIAEYGHQHQIPVMQPSNPNTKSFREELQKWQPEAMIVVAYGRILRQKVLDLAPHGCINIHFSLLPKYRGASPVNAAILNGDKETGITIMQMVRKMDAGPILYQYQTPISSHESTGQLLQRLGVDTGKYLIEVLEKLEKGTLSPTPQTEEEATYCSIIDKKEGQISWDKSADYIKRLVYAMSPWPSAYSQLILQDNPQKPQRIIIHEADVEMAESTVAPGSITKVTKEHIWVSTGKGLLKINQLQKSGKSCLTTKEFLLGTKVKIGDKFE